MANELNLTVQLQYVSGRAADFFSPGSVGISQAAQGAHSPIAIATTNPTAIPFGDLVTPGLVVGRNLASSTSSAYLLIGPTTTSTGSYYPFLKVKGGEPFAFRLAGNLWKWRASAGAIKVQLKIFED